MPSKKWSVKTSLLTIIPWGDNLFFFFKILKNKCQKGIKLHLSHKCQEGKCLFLAFIFAVNCKFNWWLEPFCVQFSSCVAQRRIKVYFIPPDTFFLSHHQHFYLFFSYLCFPLFILFSFFILSNRCFLLKVGCAVWKRLIQVDIERTLKVQI